MATLPSALDSFRAAYQLQPDNPDVGRELTIELVEVGRFAEAVTVAGEVSSRAPGDAGLKADLALALVLDGQIARASKAIDEALQQDPDDPITRGLREHIREIASGARRQPKTIRELEE